MPFMIPIMIGASVLSMLPSFFGSSEQKRANEVIAQDGNNYFNRQTWRTGNPRGTSRRPYPKVELKPRSGQNGINISQYALYGGIAVGVIVLLKIILRRRN